MRYRPLGQSGIEASVVALGTWAIGGWMWGGTDAAEAVKTIHAAIDAGMNLIDTAPIYGFGTSEELVGKAIAERRDKVVLATKCGLVWHTEKGDFYFNSSADKVGPKPNTYAVRRYLGPESIRYEVEQSLKRLNTDVIDLYQTHWQETTTAICDTMAELLRLKEEGKIRAIGVCNATPEQMEKYAAVAPVDSDQEKYSMLDRGKESDDLPYCRKHGLAFLAYSPIAQGLLTAKVGPNRKFSENDLRAAGKRFSVENRNHIASLLAAIRPIADAHHISLAQLAIAWTVQQPGCTHALVGARKVQQALENAAAGDLVFSPDELASIDRALAAHKDII